MCWCRDLRLFPCPAAEAGKAQSFTPAQLMWSDPTIQPPRGESVDIHCAGLTIDSAIPLQIAIEIPIKVLVRHLMERSQPDVMTETPKPTPQSGEPVIFKKEDGNYRVSQITGDITEPLLIQDEIADLEDAKRVAKGVLTGGQTWYHDYRDPPGHLEPLR
jgi:hypothetical protein